MNTIKTYIKTITRKTIVAHIILGLISTSLFASSFGMIFPNSHMLEEFAVLRATDYIQILGMIKLVSVVGLWIPKIQRVSLLVLSGYLGGAIMANITMGEFPVAPGSMLVLLWLGMHIKIGNVLR